MNLKNKLDHALRSNAHFFLLEGNEQESLGIVREYFSATHQISMLDAAELKVENARNLVLELAKKSLSHELFIITHFEMMSEASQNILLKSLEEMVGEKMIFGLCSHTFGILDTVISRAYHIFVPANDDKASGSSTFYDKTKLEKIAYFSSCLDENNVLEYTVFMEKIAGQAVSATQLRAYRQFVEYHQRIEANCNKELCADLLLYQLLEE